jgi:hypothetical protein
MRKVQIAGISLVALLLNSCKNDLNILAPYKEIPQVHAIITPQDSINMIRINKVYLGEGNANDMAKVPDSVNYKAGDLTVWLERYYYGTKAAAETSTGKTEVYFHDSIIQLEEGAFARTQRVYVSSDKLFSDGVYKLNIKNNHTGNLFTATTIPVAASPTTGLPPLAYPYYPYTPNVNTPAYYLIDYSNTNVQNSVRTKAAANGYIHDLTIRLNYYDSVSASSAYPTGKIYHTFDYIFFPKQLYEQKKYSNVDYFEFTFNSANLFSELATQINQQATPVGFKGRKVWKIDYICMAASQEYYDYLQFSAPSLSFAQEKVLYSNFDKKAALGIFTFRSRLLVQKVMANSFIDEFAYNKYTCQLFFFKSDFTFGSCP